jgi:hypothetical protein
MYKGTDLCVCKDPMLRSLISAICLDLTAVIINLDLQKHGAAVTAFQKALKLDPANVEIKNKLRY